MRFLQKLFHQALNTMKKQLLILMFVFLAVFASAQVNTYLTTGSDYRFTGVMLDDTQDPTMVPRFTLWWNFSENFHVDLTQSFGFFTGIGLVNHGFIAQYDDSLNTKVKFRTYNLEVPLGIKIGRVGVTDPMFFFMGGAIGLPVHYKEKVFYNDKKDHIIREYFSDRVVMFQPSAFVGMTISKSLTLKVQYYFNDFMNTTFSENVGGIVVKPYLHMLHSNVIAVSVGGSFTGLKMK